MARAKSATRNSGETRESLLDAAQAEFNTRGFHGTDTNRIARRAGFAPQTFYRHYADKVAIFLAVYERWWRSESDAIGAILRARGPVNFGKVADTMIGFHVKWKGFRRSLRHLSAADTRVRAARTAARKAQIVNFKAAIPKTKRSDVQIYAALLIFERLCDAMAEGEFADTGFAKASARGVVITALKAAL
jgi:AcrR family transcriptional regulator